MNCQGHIKPALIGFLFLATVPLGPGVGWSVQDSLSMDKSFLQKAAEGQQAEIATLPLLKEHMEQAKTVASGIDSHS
jgi:hypothetical protein